MNDPARSPTGIARLLRQLWIVIGAVVAALILSWVVYMPSSDQRGVWRADTGGRLIALSPLQTRLYSETPVSCVLQATFPAHLKLVELAQGTTFDVENDRLMLRQGSTLAPIPFSQIESLPENCGPPNPNASPLSVFDALWSAMDAHYPFFDLHDVDWDSRLSLAPDTAPTLRDEDLFTLLSRTLAGLDDGHVRLASPLGSYSPAQLPDWFAGPAMLDRATLWQTARITLGTPLAQVDLTAIEYTRLPDGVGYVLIRILDLDTPFGATQGPAMAEAFAEVATALSDTSAIILDLRYTPGGTDTAALAIAGHFVSEPVDVLTRSTWSSAGPSTPFTATLQPSASATLTQPVIVLTSRLTASSAEVLTLALRDQDNVTIMGEATAGTLSDVLTITLPNGWVLGLSNQIYRSMDGTLYEGVGIPPDVEFTIDGAALSQGQDPLLRAAFERARAQ